MKIADAEKAFREYFVIADKFAVRLCFANFFGNSFLPHRDPIWMILLGKSSSGKSTFINPTLAFQKTKKQKKKKKKKQKKKKKEKKKKKKKNREKKKKQIKHICPRS